MRGQFGIKQLITLILVLVFCLVVFMIVKNILGGIFG